MNAKTILSHVDHTLLSPCATWEEIQTLCDEAVRYQTASVCIPPAYVSRVAQKYDDKVNICTVIGFPLGYQTTEAKRVELCDALQNGASEFDFVVNLGDVKNGEFKKITDEISILKQAAAGRILKVIVETCYLTETEKIALCHCVTDGGADFIKTSTGFGTAGATLADIELFKRHIGEKVRIKASGGIRTAEDFEAYVAAGCDRIGASSAVKLYAKNGETI